MKKLYPLLSVLFLIYWGCEEEIDTTPPTVTVTFPQNNSSVFEMISITCISSDNEGVEKVELWVNGVTTGLTDNSEPYSFDWNTTLIDNGSYSITVRSFDTSDTIALDDESTLNPTGACCYDGLCWSISEEECNDVSGSYTAEACSADTECPTSCSADTNNDSTVDVHDLLAIIDAWGACN